MTVYTDDEGRIKAVESTKDETLIPVEIIDDEDNPFNGWSVSRICCYRVRVADGRVVMMTPYKNSILLDVYDEFGSNDIQMTEDIISAEQEITEQDLSLLEAEQEITDMDLRIMELENAQEGE